MTEELTIDINQYIQWDEDGENVIYFNVTNFTNIISTPPLHYRPDCLGLLSVQ